MPRRSITEPRPCSSFVIVTLVLVSDPRLFDRVVTLRLPGEDLEARDPTHCRPRFLCPEQCCLTRQPAPDRWAPGVLQ